MFACFSLICCWSLCLVLLPLLSDIIFQILIWFNTSILRVSEGMVQRVNQRHVLFIFTRCASFPLLFIVYTNYSHHVKPTIFALLQVLTHRCGSASLLLLLYSEILKMLRLWGFLSFDIEVFFPHDSLSSPRGYCKQKTKESDQLRVMTTQSLLKEVNFPESVRIYFHLIFFYWLIIYYMCVLMYPLYIHTHAKKKREEENHTPYIFLLKFF